MHSQSPSSQSTSDPPLILMIDDDPEDSDLVRRLLRSSFQLAHEDSLAAGMEALEEQEFALLLLDLRMPKCSELTSLETILEAGFELPIIVLTGVQDEDLGVEAIARGAQDFLCKNDLTREPLLKSIRYAMERSRLTTQLRDTKEQLLSVTSQEQLRIATDIHDGVFPLLEAADLQLLETIEKCEVGDLLSREDLVKVRELFQRSHEATRRAVRGLQPPDLDSQSFGGSLHNLAAETQQRFSVVTQMGVNPTLHIRPMSYAKQLYLIVNEALRNAVRHAAATQINIQLQLSRHKLVMEIIDNGNGFDQSSISELSQGLGLRSMHYRGAAIGGRLTVHSQLDVGTTVRCVVPLRRLQVSRWQA